VVEERVFFYGGVGERTKASWWGAPAPTRGQRAPRNASEPYCLSRLLVNVLQISILTAIHALNKFVIIFAGVEMSNT
jgi:hypothetical protein